jgi:cyanate lyase
MSMLPSGAGRRSPAVAPHARRLIGPVCSAAAAVPADPLIYRWVRNRRRYGTTIKELIHEEFGDGIMSAIDFRVTRQVFAQSQQPGRRQLDGMSTCE